MIFNFCRAFCDKEFNIGPIKSHEDRSAILTRPQLNKLITCVNDCIEGRTTERAQQSMSLYRPFVLS